MSADFSSDNEFEPKADPSSDSDSISDFLSRPDQVYKKPKETKDLNPIVKNFHDYEGVQLEIIDSSNFLQGQEDYSNYLDQVLNRSLDLVEPSDDVFKKKNKVSNTYAERNNYSSEEEELKENQVPKKRPHCETDKSVSRRESNPLLEFFDNPYSSMKKGKAGPKKSERKYPKKEYYRTKLLRSWKKAIRMLKKVNSENSDNIFMTEFRRYAERNFSKLMDMGRTENGPMTEGQARRESVKEGDRTFNNSHVRKIFQCQIARKSFILFINALFYNKTCEQLKKRFDFMCCDQDSHTQECEDKWKRLQQFSIKELILNVQEVDI